MILSLCIPTFNRAGILNKTCRAMLNLKEFDSEVELVICDNCSSDSTPTVVEQLKKDYPDKNIVYHRNGENVRDKNFYLCLTFGSGEYRKLLNDYTYITPSGLTAMKSAVLKHRDDNDCSLLFGGDLKEMNGKEAVAVCGPDRVIRHLYHHITWISNFGVFERDLHLLEGFLDKWTSQLLQVYWILYLSEVKSRTVIYNFEGKYGRTPIPDSYRVPYNLFNALVRNYYDILYSYRDLGLISNRTLRIDKVRSLKSFVGWSIRDLLILKENSCYETDKGMAICKKYFSTTPYFYYLYIKALLKMIRNLHWVRIPMFLKGHLFNPLWLSRLERRRRRENAFGKYLEAFMARKYLASVNSIENNINISNVREDNPEQEKIFSIWFQGEDKAPDLIKSCFASIRKHCNKELIVLDEKTIFDYITLPEPIIEKFRSGKIKYCHFADICRVELLYKYGGWWIDATCFLTSDFHQIIKDSEFFVYLTGNKIGGSYGLIQNCFIHAVKGSFLLASWRAMILDYWMHENKRVDYFQHQVMFRTLVRHNETAKAQFALMPKIEQDPTHIIWYDKADEPLDLQLLDELSKEGFCFQKTSYRYKTAPIPGTFKDYIVNYWKREH